MVLKMEFENYEERLTREVKDFAKRVGADLVGIADAKRLVGSPQGHSSPLRIMPKSKSIIVIAKRFPHGAIDVPHPPVDGPIEELEAVHGGCYVATYMSINSKLSEMSYEIANFLETEKKYLASPVTPTMPRDEVRWLGTISLRKAAEEAGLGDIGVNQLVLTPQFGPRCRFAAIITNAPLVIDGPKLRGKVCTHCFKCAEACPVKAIEKRPNDLPENYDRLTNYSLVKCMWASATAFYKVSGCQQPPGDWANAKTPQEVATIRPKYVEKYPKVVAYQNLSLKVSGYPNCDVCMGHCEVGINSRKRDMIEE